jgi:hypothetical protein
MATRQVHIVQPLRVIETLEDGVDVQAAPLFDNLDGNVGFIKSSAQNKVVQIELSLHLSFHPRRSLGGYMVGTNTGFPVKTVEALGP